MKNTETTKKRGFAMKLLFNILAMIFVGCLIIIGALYWLDSWTLHGKEELVPDVKGRPFESAETILRSSGFTVVLSDSVYDQHTSPGTVVEQNPKVNSRVKPGRVIYLTINAFSPKNVTLPALTDISVRQARSILEALGITRIEEVSVPSEFPDLVLAAKRNGKPLLPGARIPVNSIVRLEVGDGLPTIADSTSSVMTGEATMDQLDLL